MAKQGVELRASRAKDGRPIQPWWDGLSEKEREDILSKFITNPVQVMILASKGWYGLQSDAILISLFVLAYVRNGMALWKGYLL